MKVAAYLNSGGQQERLPLLDDRLFRKLQKKGVVTGKMISCRQVASPKFKGLAMEFKNGTAKFSSEIQPRLPRIALSVLSSKLGISIPYAVDVRSARRIPHPRHWQSLAQLVGVSHA